MPQRSWKWCMFLGLTLSGVLACDPYTLMGRPRTTSAAPADLQSATPPPAATAPEERPLDVASQLKALEARVSNLESQVRALEQAGPLPASVPEAAPGAKGKVPAAKAPAPPVPAPAKAGAEDKTFTEGMRLYQAKKYSAAREKFHASLKSLPQGPKAAEARFYLAESFYHEKKYREAGVEFNKLVTQHPKSMLAPAAMLRQALCYNQMKQRANYQTTLKKLVQKYPQSPEAKEAQKWLKEGH